MVRRVKGFENGFIASPVVMSPTNTVEDLDRLKASKGISGVPITVGTHTIHVLTLFNC